MEIKVCYRCSRIGFRLPCECGKLAYFPWRAVYDGWLDLFMAWARQAVRGVGK